MRVDKTLKTLTEHTAFDKTLFRSNKVVDMTEFVTEADLTLHPAFEYIHNMGKMLAKEAVILHPGRDESRRVYRDNLEPCTTLVHIAMANEQATNPPISYARLKHLSDREWFNMKIRYSLIDDVFRDFEHILPPKGVDLKNRNGVTVYEVLQGLEHYFGNNMTPELAPPELCMRLYGFEVNLPSNKRPLSVRHLVIRGNFEG
jgi:hypothetical protein